jgi:hypothetical protein
MVLIFASIALRVLGFTGTGPSTLHRAGRIGFAGDSVISGRLFRRTSRAATGVALAVLSGWLAAASTACAGEPITVVLKNGQRLKGRLDPRTGDDQLCLRFGEGSVHVMRRIGWEDVSSLARDTQALSPEAVRQMARSAPPNEHVSDPASNQIPVRPTFAIGWPGTHRAVPPPGAMRVASVAFEVGAVNWDADVELDGLLIRPFPHDAHGEPLPFRGMLHAELWSMRRIEQDSMPSSGGRWHEIVESWSVPVRIDSTDRRANWVRLPFQSRHPEFDTTWSPVGLVHLTLVVPGHGVFHHSEDGVRIRPFAPLRDYLERQTGERFLPTERNGPPFRGNSH